MRAIDCAPRPSATWQERLAGSGEGPKLGLVLGHHFSRKLCVVEVRAEALALMNRPPQELGQGLALNRIALILIHEDVRKRRDRVGASPGAFTIDTRMSSGIVAVAAAAETPSSEGSTNLPAWFCSEA